MLPFAYLDMRHIKTLDSMQGYGQDKKKTKLNKNIVVKISLFLECESDYVPQT